MASLIEMPKLSDTMTVGTLVRWLKNEGEAVANGDMIAEVETDKATMEVECFDDGVLLKQYCNAGDEVAVGGPIAAVGEEGEEAPEVEAPSPAPESGGEEEKNEEARHGRESDEEKKAAEQASTQEPPKKPVRGSAPAAKRSGGGERVKASPLARKIAAEMGVDLHSVEGSGPGGRIVRADVEAAAEGRGTPGKAAAIPAEPAPAAPAPGLESLEIPVSNMRKSIAKALVASKSEAPHFYLQMEVDGGPLAELRTDLNAKLAELPPEQGGVKFTINDLILKAAAEAVRRVPAINRSWAGDTIVQHGNVHMAFGVAVDEGLVTPVIRAAEGKGLRVIAAEARQLIAKARNKKLAPEEMSGSTLTVTNLGMFGISDFYGIINPGNAAILSVGATVTRPVVDATGAIIVGRTMKVGLSGDHRVIDGAVGAQYLQALRDILETPALMLV
jgi:pyruvate dehydrogenase E2 component (dihydrolipoamide acetyltransferase)